MVVVEAVSLTLGRRTLRAVVTDLQGHRRAIEVSWHAKDNPGVPLDGWLDSIHGEVDYQRAQEHAEAAGRYVP